MDLGLTGRAAVVTAASKGLGRAAALAVAAEGCDPVLSRAGFVTATTLVVDGGATLGL